MYYYILCFVHVNLFYIGMCVLSLMCLSNSLRNGRQSKNYAFWAELARVRGES